MSYRLNQRAKRLLESAGADEVGDDYVSFNMVVIPLSSKACKQLNEQANDDPDMAEETKENSACNTLKRAYNNVHG